MSKREPVNVEVTVVPQQYKLRIPQADLEFFLSLDDVIDMPIVDGFHSFAEKIAEAYGLHDVAQEIRFWRDRFLGQPITPNSIIDLIYIVMQIEETTSGVIQT